MAGNLSGVELVDLIKGVFQPKPDERALLIMVDLPDAVIQDNPDWYDRRLIAAEWVRALSGAGRYDVKFAVYRNPRMNNAELPPGAWLVTADTVPATADDLDEKDQVMFADLFADRPMILAPTEFSATAPLKLVARQYGIRGATMPGFCRPMTDALRLDYVEVNRRVNLMADILDTATGATFRFSVAGTEPGAARSEMKLFLDLRYRMGHRSGGRFPEPGQVGNLPSGEAYIVPYEGELEGDPTASRGLMPVQFDDEVVVYRIEQNRAVEVMGDGPAAEAEREHLQAEPAYGNIAELGVGVLADFGVKPLGEILIDEKLGLHIAFGRSDHFGGQVGPGSFSCPSAVIHIDRVYIPEMQPHVRVELASIHLDERPDVVLIRDNEWVFQF